MPQQQVIPGLPVRDYHCPHCKRTFTWNVAPVMPPHMNVTSWTWCPQSGAPVAYEEPTP